ncbi:MAG: hypothetical protein AB7F79_12195 [Steroidobacteraceae bacterium]
MNCRQFLLMLVVVVVGSLVASGCTTKAWYDGIGSSAKYECKHKPVGEIERCLERLNNMTYAEYQQEKQKINSVTSSDEKSASVAKSL